MNKQVLDINQMQHLQELGIDTSNASMVNCCIRDGYEYKHFLIESKYRFYKGNAIAFPTKNSVDYCKSVTPAYTLQDVLDALPKNVSSNGKSYYLNVDLCVGYVCYDRRREDDLLVGVSFAKTGCFINAAYSLLCWAIENKFVETNKNE